MFTRAHVDRLFIRGEEIEEQGPELCAVKGGGDLTVA